MRAKASYTQPRKLVDFIFENQPSSMKSINDAYVMFAVSKDATWDDITSAYKEGTKVLEADIDGVGEQRRMEAKKVFKETYEKLERVKNFKTEYKGARVFKQATTEDTQKQQSEKVDDSQKDYFFNLPDHHRCKVSITTHIASIDNWRLWRKVNEISKAHSGSQGFMGGDEFPDWSKKYQGACWRPSDKEGCRKSMQSWLTDIYRTLQKHQQKKGLDIFSWDYLPSFLDNISCKKLSEDQWKLVADPPNVQKTGQVNQHGDQLSEGNDKTGKFVGNSKIQTKENLDKQALQDLSQQAQQDFLISEVDDDGLDFPQEQFAKLTPQAFAKYQKFFFDELFRYAYASPGKLLKPLQELKLKFQTEREQLFKKYHKKLLREGIPLTVNQFRDRRQRSL
jgi:hypothetical protein